jgi:hypothetical protein
MQERELFDPTFDDLLPPEIAAGDFDRFLRWLNSVQRVQPLSELAHEFFVNNWQSCVENLLSRTSRVRVIPNSLPAPTSFEFAIDTPYKRKLGPSAPVELMPGPVRGQIHYRPDLFEDPEGPTIAVLLDRRQGYFNPHYNPERGFLCIGDERNLPPGPLPLDQLLENHIYGIVSYQNRRPIHSANPEASRYFALDPAAMEGLKPALPLY